MSKERGTHDYVEDIRNLEVLVYINDKFYPRQDASISVFDSGFLLGDGVWEGIRLYNNHLIHLEKHLERLYEGAETIEMNIGISKSEMRSALEQTLQTNKMISDVHIRLIVSRGIKSTPYQHPKVTIGHPTIVIIPEYKKPSPELKVEGIMIIPVGLPNQKQSLLKVVKTEKGLDIKELMSVRFVQMKEGLVRV